MIPHEDATDDATVEVLVEVIRKELPLLLASRRNWKFTLNGSAGGDIRAAAEQQCEVMRRFQVLAE